MKKIILPCTIAAIAFIGCNKETNIKTQTASNSQQLWTPEQINNVIKDELAANGEFRWSRASDEMLWSAIMHSKDHIVSVGYKPFGEMNVEDRLSKINISDNVWVTAKTEVMQLIYMNEKIKRPGIKFQSLEVWPEKKLPVMDVVIKDINTLKELRHSKLVRYVEPMGYSPEAFEEKTDGAASSGSGCGGYNSAGNLIEGKDYTTIAPGCKRSWNYTEHNIPNAWTKTSGAGIKIMVIDTGESPDQENMGSDFNQGFSSGRTIEKIYTLPGAGNANDNCGHGTAMSSTVAAPRGTDGNSCGVAYNCNLVVCKAVRDVLIDESDEIKGVADAYTYAADQPDIKITSMSLGSIITYSQISDAIKYAYGKGKLMFCAGGTSSPFTAFWWGVIFPATMNEVQAITGVNNKKYFTACDDCHRGPQIDFTIVMEQAKTGKHALCNPVIGDGPALVGGSSVATATFAGIAALVWSRNSAYTREDVVLKLQTTASEYPDKKYNLGYGNPDADLATN